jgi:hypothetical protein
VKLPIKKPIKTSKRLKNVLNVFDSGIGTYVFLLGAARSRMASSSTWDIDRCQIAERISILNDVFCAMNIDRA